MARGSTVGNPAPFAVRAVLEGRTAASALRELRDAGVGIRTQTWYRVFGEARASIDNLSAVSSLSSDTMPRAEHFTPWSAGRQGDYAYQFGIVAVDPETGLRMTVQHTVLTPDVISVGDAERAAMSDFQQGVETGSGPGTPVAPILLNLYQMVGPV